jgi:hypothetical protein
MCNADVTARDGDFSATSRHSGPARAAAKARSSVSGESSVDVVHADDGSDAFEDRLRHDEKR